jgi:hypothetical protein
LSEETLIDVYGPLLSTIEQSPEPIQEAARVWFDVLGARG